MGNVNGAVRAVKLSSLVHATEDSEKVIKAMSQVFPDHMPRPAGHNARGHYGNEIRTLEVQCRNSGVAEGFLAIFWKRLPVSDRQEILSNIGSYINEDGRLYLRVDKQLAFQGEMKLSQAEPIRVEITFDVRAKQNKQAAIVIARRLDDLSTRG